MRRISGLLASLSLLAVGGCLYGFAGGGLPPSIKTVAVLPFENQTAEPTLTAEVNSRVREAVQGRLGLRQASENQADAVVRGTITRYEPDLPVAYQGEEALEQFGTAATFGLTALAVVVAVGALLLQPSPPRPDAGPLSVPPSPPSGQPPEHPGSRAVQRPGVDLGRALTLLARNRVLAILALTIILAEIFGFATQTLLPTFARDVYDVGASGLGLMTAVRSGGGALGLLVLSRLGAEGRAGLVFLSGAGAFGLALFLFAISPLYALALGLLAISGLCASIMDTLGQTLIQRNAHERERGAAMGVWVFSVGFGPVGHLTLGAAATSFGAPLAQAVSGVSLMLVAAVMAFHAPLRRAR